MIDTSHLRMLLISVLRQICPWDRLLTHITKGNISATVYLMSGEVSFWYVVLAVRKTCRLTARKT